MTTECSGCLRQEGLTQWLGQAFGREPNAQVRFGERFVSAGKDDLTIAFQVQAASGVVIQGIAVTALDVGKTAL